MRDLLPTAARSHVSALAMARPRSLADGCASATSLAIKDVESGLHAVECFMGMIGASVESFAFSRTCNVSHPDGLACRCKMEVFLLPSGAHLLDITRLTGDAVLFALVFRLLRAFMATSAEPALVPGQLFKRCRLAPSMDPCLVPPFELPPV